MTDGQAGASARREFERRRRARDAALASAPPLLRDALGALRASARSARETAAWDRGAEGERVVGRALDQVALEDPRIRVLHDRRTPSSTGNVDHLVVAPSGVYIIDAKHYTGRPRLETRGSGASETRRLFVDRADRTALVDGVRWQAIAVEEVLREPGVPVRGVLCFVGADWSIGNGLLVDGVGITSPERLAPLLRSAGPLPPERVASLHHRLRESLASA